MKKAFTLAEVLITLSILGVVAAISIPSIIRHYQEKATVVKLKKVYSNLNSAFEEATLEHGPVPEWFNSNLYQTIEINIYNIIKSYFNVIEECTPNNGNCFAPLTEYKNIIGGDTYFSVYSTAYNNDKIFTSNDGISIWIHSHTKDKCISGEEYCFAIYVDVNGRKDPNRQGLDLFKISAFHGINGKSDYLVPDCNRAQCISKIINGSYNGGLGCACWVLYKGNMDYKRRDISASEWNF